METQTALWKKIARFVASATGFEPSHSTGAAEASADQHLLSLLRVADGEASKLMWILDGAAYKSLQSQALRDYVARLPKGTQITFSPARSLMLGQRSHMAEAEEFALFCEQKKMVFLFNSAL